MSSLYIVVDPWKGKVAQWVTTANFDELPPDYASVFRTMVAQGLEEASPMVVRFFVFSLLGIYTSKGQPRYAVVKGSSDAYFKVVNLLTGSVSCQYDMTSLEALVRSLGATACPNNSQLH